MKGYRFYAEMAQERGSKSASKACPFFPWTVAALRERVTEGGFITSPVNRAPCVVAVLLDEHDRPSYCHDGTIEAASVAIDGNHMSYCWGSVSRDYLAKRTTRIPEDLARALSPELFRRLES